MATGEEIVLNCLSCEKEPVKELYYKMLRGIEYVKEIPLQIKWFYQRGRRGYSDSDVWSFDDYLTRVIAGGLKQLAENRHGFPIYFCRNSSEQTYCEACKTQRGECYANKRWQRVLNALSNRFEHYDVFEDPIFDEIYKNRKFEFVPIEGSAYLECKSTPLSEDENSRIKKHEELKERKFKGALRSFCKYFGSFWD